MYFINSTLKSLGLKKEKKIMSIFWFIFFFNLFQKS